MEHDAAWAKRAQADLRSLLNAWDPIGVWDPGEDPSTSKSADEYDCIRDPLLARLLRGEGPDDIASFLHQEIADHLGLDPALVTPDLVIQIFAWWESVC